MNERQVLELVEETLGVRPLSAERMTLTHSGNTIYDATLPQGNVIVRLRGDDADTFSKTAHNIRALAKLGLPVPRVLAADISKTRYPFAYVILEKIPGQDLLYELGTMTRDQMTRLAEQIVSFQRTVGTLPLGTGFGWGHIGEGGPERTWFDLLSSEAEQPPPLPDETIADGFAVRLRQLRARFQPYFQSVKPVCSLEDLTTKNILLENGKLQGIIDFDCVCFGDPLWMIGLAAGCVLNDVGERGLFYIEELCRCWNLTAEQNRVVACYAAQRALEFLIIARRENDPVPVGRLITGIEGWLARAEQR